MAEKREPTLEVAIGFRGVGKTYTLNEIAGNYIKTLHRPVLVFDVNNEYSDYKAIDFDATEQNEFKRSEQIRNIKAPGKYRIIPFKKNRQPMTASELLITGATIVAYYRNGMAVLEDINKYTSSHFKQEFIGTFVGLRHLGVDLVIHFQSLHAIPPKVWDNLEYLRWHKCGEKIFKYKGRVSNLELFTIAECIVDTNYQTDPHYYLWVNNLKDKLIGVTQEDFKQGCITYLNTHPQELNRIMNHISDDGNKKYKDRQSAMNSFIETKSKQYISE
jgi:hypothetical protein